MKEIMNIIYAKTKKELGKIIKFRMVLYSNDPYYCYTDSFILDMLLYKQTEYVRSCSVLPIYITNDEQNIVCSAVLIHNPKDDFIQIAFFESIKNNKEAVDLLIEEAKKFAISEKVNRIIIGLNGHLSYSVGLSVAMNHPNSFGSSYSKPYYCDYFKDYNSYNCISYATTLDNAFQNTSKIEELKTNLTIRPINMNKFKEEMEIFKDLCDKSIGNTFLYTQTDPFHFYELMKDMTFFLRKENILFVYDQDKPVGFVFWNPDYNEVMPKGKKLTLFQIALHYTLKKKKISRVTLNSIGVLEEYQGLATSLITNELKKILKTPYYKNIKYFEGSFVWENNRKANALNKHVIKTIDRQFKVFEIIL